MDDVTELLARWHRGDRGALDELMPIVYRELRAIAQHYMRREHRDHTLQPTALINEAYIRLIGNDRRPFNSRAHFYGAAATAMRRILVDHARRERAQKRGEEPAMVSLDAVQVGVALREDLGALDDALTRLAAEAPQPARVVELRYFGGLSVEETAEALGVSPATVKRHWAYARAWLLRALTSPAPPS